MCSQENFPIEYQDYSWHVGLIHLWTLFKLPVVLCFSFLMPVFPHFVPASCNDLFISSHCLSCFLTQLSPRSLKKLMVYNPRLCTEFALASFTFMFKECLLSHLIWVRFYSVQTIYVPGILHFILVIFLHFVLLCLSPATTSISYASE